MTQIAVRDENDRRRLMALIQSRKPPFTASLSKGAPRSLKQNRLQRLWMNEAEEQGDHSAEEYRAFCKLHFGVPILRAAHEDFREQYDRVVRPLEYEMKLLLMQVPIDFPVTRLMTVPEKRQYLDDVYQHFTGLGMGLTEPDWAGRELA